MKNGFTRTTYIIEALSEKVKEEHHLSTQDIAPCHLACPVGINVKGYVTAIADGEFEKALAIVRENNCLPSVCGRICTHPCERECTRSDYGGAINIRALKRFVSDYERRQGREAEIKKQELNKEKVAIIGAGAAGLAAAYDLVRFGYDVTIFEKEDTPGGLMVWGIPNFRLPNNSVLYDIERIKQLGVKIETGAPIINSKQFNQIYREFNAVLLAVGAHREPAKYWTLGNKVSGILDYLPFMKAYSSNLLKTSGGTVAVTGFGQTALDVARTALRAGYSKSILIYGRTKSEFQVFPSDITTANSEGVEILFQTQVTGINESGGKLKNIRCTKRDVGSIDANGRRTILEKQDSEFTIDIDAVIPVEPHYPDLSFLPENTKCRISRWGYPIVNADTLDTGDEGIFAAGDAVTGPKSVIEAMAGGRHAAKTIHRYLRGNKRVDEHIKRYYPMILEPETPKEKTPLNPVVSPWQKNIPAFKETEKVYSDVRAKEEARRCLRCGPCMECARCSSDCAKEVIMLSHNENFFKARFQKTKREEIIFSGHKALNLKRVVTVPPEISSVSATQLDANATFCIVNPDLCSGCGACEEICEYRAPRVEYINGRFVAAIDKDICRECGTCSAHCPSSAIMQQYFTDEFIEHEIEKGLKD